MPASKVPAFTEGLDKAWLWFRVGSDMLLLPSFLRADPSLSQDHLLNTGIFLTCPFLSEGPGF